ncbi:MAG TPA: glycosyltransferase family 87 protein [Candidatus Limnocylindrales bacterium]|nr:glycosyltransferase family 87 protein [Candidatus Limnocylindrales bacterium]
MTTSDAASRGVAPHVSGSPHRRRYAVIRRALRQEVSRIRDRRRILAMTLLIITFGCIAAGLVARGEPAGADARAYWAAVRIWLGGGDPYRPTGPFLPYVYAPWMLPLFAPWALMPWDVAWFVWRGGTILGLLWTIHWAYSRRPLATAITVALLGFPFGANLDTGNINLLLALLLWGAQFSGPILAGALWAIASWMKWVPIVFMIVLRPRARLWGLGFLVASIALSLATLPGTIAQLTALFGFGRRPLRLDYIVFLWALVPVLWRQPDPFASLRPRTWRSLLERWRRERRSRIRRARTWLGLPHGSPDDRRRTVPTDPPTAGSAGAAADPD